MGPITQALTIVLDGSAEVLLAVASTAVLVDLPGDCVPSRLWPPGSTRWPPTSTATRVPRTSVRSRLATILIKLGRKEDVLLAFQKDNSAGEATPATKGTAARLALELGRKDVARTLAESVVADDPRKLGALLALADVACADEDLASALAERGRDEDALSALEHARQIPEASVERGRIPARAEVERQLHEIAP